MTRPARPEGGKSMQPERPPRRAAARPPRRRVPSVGALGRWVRANIFTPPWLPARWRRPSAGYLAAVLLQGVAGAVVALLAMVSAGAASPTLFSLLTVALVALTWGAGPSLLATLMGTVLLGALLRSSVLHIAENDAGRWEVLTLFLVVGAALSALASRVARERRDARDQAAQLEAVLDAIGDGVYVYDIAGRILRANATGRALLPTDAHPDYLARPVADRLPVFAARDARGHPLTPARWPLTRLLRGETLTDAEAIDMTIRAPSGEEREVTMAGAPILDREGRRIGVVAITRDVTERRRLERRTGAALRALLAMADAVVRGAAADEGCAAGDDTTGGEDTTAGAVGQRLTELTRRVLDCRRVGIIVLQEGRLEPVALAGDSPDAARVWRADIAAFAPHADPASGQADRLRAGEVIVVDPARPPFRGRSPDGAAAVLVAPLRADGALVGVLHLDYGPAAHAYTDEERALALGAAQLAALVLERERLGAARAEATWLAARDRARAAFVATVSHELRTPLTAIQAGLGFLERAVGGRLGPDERALLDAIRRNAARLRRQIDDLLIANRLDAGALHPDRRPLDLAAVARTALDEVRPLLDEQGQDVTLDLSTPLPVAGDARLLGQVVVNLLVNVYRHTPSGTRVTLTGRVAGGAGGAGSAGSAGDEVCLCVGDDGPGLPPNELEAIFGRFHRADAAAGGSGLGLSIAREIVALHGGRLWAANAAGGGAAFHLALPRDAGAAAGTVEGAEKQGGQP